ncbi:LruC domain-containing protein [Prevotella sp. ne3005]|uniref:DUF4842 domain-containing protein n=1 Tax=Prevotella sp. ne3005 TaxID=1761887 RepID=UPI0008D125C0|nr:DUF4842 domain-containing protein [Prevotella sp. ne3005]SEM98014.1 LruC domain-containing protein [Prevotella sp. ne3005]
MKKRYLLTITVLALIGCVNKPDFSEFNPNLPSKEEIRKNNESIFGTIDPNQDWNMFSSGSITILADAPLDNIVKIQVLTESPFFNDNAMVLNETKANYGDEVTLTFDAPYDLTRLIAACVDANGHYYIKGFDIGTQKVSFTSSTASTRAMTRGAYGFPNISKLTSADSYVSYNAGRTQAANSGVTDYSAWKGKGWESERLWGKTDGIYKAAEPITAEEVAELKDIFSVSLQRAANGSRVKDNMKYINNSKAVQFFDNHLISDGKSPIIITPVNLISTEAYMCDLYYYYYKDEDIPSGMSKTEYIKLLPKFKAADLKTEREAFKANTNIERTKNDPNFLKIHDYLLPFYGDPAAYMPNNMSVKEQGYETDGKLYRISYIAEDGRTLYMTPTSDTNKNLVELYSDNDENIANQLWQVFKNSEGKCMFYNVGTKVFLKYVPNSTSAPLLTRSDTDFDNFWFILCDKNNNPTTGMEDVHIIKEYNKKKFCINGNAQINLGQRTDVKDRTTIRWTFHEYTPTKSIAKVEDVILDIWPTTFPDPKEVFDQGYNIGIMLRKTNNNDNISNSKNGCLYSYGELNKEINSFGDFNRAVTEYSMQLNSPRIALCQANNKSYLTFEDGCDTNFGDIIIEIKNGVEKIEEDDVEVEYMSYMMCFEDSPLADYDLNDVVLKFQRTDDTHVEVTLLACGAHDELYLQGLQGQKINKEAEVHSLFGVTPEMYVNTESGDLISPITETFTIDKELPIWQFMKNVWISDKTTGIVVKLSEQGESPCAIIVPGNIGYPLEKVRITTAYPDFKSWVNNATENRDWYKNYEEKKIFKGHK